MKQQEKHDDDDKKKQEPFIAPDGGWGWIVVLGAGFANFCIFPVLQSFGIIFRDKFEDLGITSAQTTTIINTNSAVTACIGLANGPLFRRFSYRQVSLAGALICAICVTTLSTMKTFTGILIFFSILFGAGTGISSSANSLALNTYFKKKRRIATGLSWTCTGLGPIIMPQIITPLLPIFGVAGTVLIFGGFAFNAVPCALLLQPVSWHIKKKKAIDRPEIDEADESGEGLLNESQYKSLDNVNGSTKLASENRFSEKFSSQYLYYDDEEHGASGIDVFNPGTPMMSRANDGWYSRQSIAASNNSLASNKISNRENSQKNLSRYSSVSLSRHSSCKALSRQNSESESRSNLSEKLPKRKLSNLPSAINSPLVMVSESCEHMDEGCNKEKCNNEECVKRRLAQVFETARKNQVAETEDECKPSQYDPRAPWYKRFFKMVVIFFDLDLLKDLSYVNLMMGVTFANFAEINFSLLTPFILAEYGLDPTERAMAMSILAGVDVATRLLIPFVAGYIGWQNKFFFIFGVCLMAVGRAVLAHMHSYSMMMFLSVWIGVGKGFKTIFMALVIPTHVTLDRLPGATGLQLIFSGIMFLILGPVVGWVRDTTGDYTLMLHFLNFFTFMTSISWITEKWVTIWRQRKRTVEKECTGDVEKFQLEACVELVVTVTDHDATVKARRNEPIRLAESLSLVSGQYVNTKNKAFPVKRIVVIHGWIFVTTKIKQSEGIMSKKLVPPDGGWGWLIVVAYAINGICTIPVMQGFGLLFRGTCADLGMSGTDISIILNVNSACGMALGLANGPLLRYFGCRRVALCAAIFYSLGLTLCAWANSFIYFIITYGVVCSISTSVMNSAFSLSLNSYFMKKRGRAVALAMTLNGLGPIVVPQLISVLLTKYDVTGTTFILGGLVLHVVVAALLLQPIQWHLIEDTEESDPEAVPKLAETEEKDRNDSENCKSRSIEDIVVTERKRVLTMSSVDHEIDSGSLYGFETLVPRKTSITYTVNPAKRTYRRSVSQVDSSSTAATPVERSDPTYKWWSSGKSLDTINLGSSIKIFEGGKDDERRASEAQALMQKKKVETVHEEEDDVEDDDQQTNPKEKDIKKEKSRISRMLHAVVVFFDFDLLRDPVYVSLMLGMSIAVFAELNFSILTPFILSDMSFDTEQIATVMSCIAVTDLIFRALAPFIGEFLNQTPRVMYLLSLITLIITRLSLFLASGFRSVVIIGFGLGVAKGVRSVYMSLTLASYVPIQKLASATGIQMVTNGIILLILGPLLGLLRDKTGNYDLCLLFINGITFITVMMWTLEIIIRKIIARRSKNAENNEEAITS
ncbi:uncharacterized protein LOC124412739 [Diprion similis]|uniref:uncharacterized protein LOC124412739 n=1 Tax=Diprion similis TaxID=362088 RepID=UPI001EF97AF7|nr:uncharacterized protein LOC124412739 [Diprion similis]